MNGDNTAEKVEGEQNHLNDDNTAEKVEGEQNHLKHFWEIVTFKKLPQTTADVRTLIQVEMMKFHSRAVICKILPPDTEKYSFGYFVKETEKDYFCKKSKLVVKDTSDVRCIIDIIVGDDMKWGIETNLEGSFYLIASWKHWGEHF